MDADPLAAELDKLVRRLRRLSPTALAVRRSALEALLVSLAETGRPPRAAPVVADHALADAVAVLGNDALDVLAAEPDPARSASLLAAVRAAKLS